MTKEEKDLSIQHMMEGVSLNYTEWLENMESSYAFNLDGNLEFDAWICKQIGQIRFGWLILSDESSMFGYSVEKKF